MRLELCFRLFFMLEPNSNLVHVQYHVFFFVFSFDGKTEKQKSNVYKVCDTIKDLSHITWIWIWNTLCSLIYSSFNYISGLVLLLPLLSVDERTIGGKKRERNQFASFAYCLSYVDVTQPRYQLWHFQISFLYSTYRFGVYHQHGPSNSKREAARRFYFYYDVYIFSNYNKNGTQTHVRKRKKTWKHWNLIWICFQKTGRIFFFFAKQTNIPKPINSN